MTAPSPSAGCLRLEARPVPARPRPGVAPRHTPLCQRGLTLPVRSGRDRRRSVLSKPKYLVVIPLTAATSGSCSNCASGLSKTLMGFPVAEAQEESGSGKRQNTRVRFIEQFLRQGQQGRLAGLVLGQLDAFNRIATTFGHEQSDVFCAGYTDRLREILPARTPILRLSERRFALLVDSDSMTAIMDVAVALTENNPPQLTVAGDQFGVDLTLGIAVYPSHADDAATLFRRAELALKEAREKELAFDIYRPDATQQQAALWKFETELQNAVQRGQLEVYFQPKVEIASRRVCGVEALVRWRTESGSFVPASDFVPLAETTGVIVPLTWLVFERIAERLGDWSAIPRPFSVAVNVSPQILTQAEFLTRVKALKAALDEHSIGLTIELTEDSLVQGDGS